MGVGLEIGASGVLGNEAPSTEAEDNFTKTWNEDIVSANGNIGKTRVEQRMV